MKSRKKIWRSAMALITIAIWLAAATRPVALADGNSNPRVLPPHSKPYGLTYGEWSARWWQWAFSIPLAEHPFIDSTGANCGAGQSGKVWFLVGATGGEVRNGCVVPAGKALFFPIINVECSTLEPPPFFGSNEAELRSCAEGFLNNIADLTCEIDGQAIQNLNLYRGGSPLFEFTVPDGNILGVAAGSGLSVADGIYVMLAPLPVGAHTIHFTGTFVDLMFTIDTTYNLTVVPHSS
jgi:hypothetical protein